MSIVATTNDVQMDPVYLFFSLNSTMQCIGGELIAPHWPDYSFHVGLKSAKLLVLVNQKATSMEVIKASIRLPETVYSIPYLHVFKRRPKSQHASRPYLLLCMTLPLLMHVDLQDL